MFTIFRTILFFTEIDRLDLTQANYLNILRAFFLGVRFDIVISGYIMLLPAVILLIQEVLHKYSQVVNRVIFYWVFILFSFGFLISAADVPYFNHFFKRFDVGAFEWMDSPVFVFQMIVEEPRYIFMIFPFVVIVWVYFKLLKDQFARFERNYTTPRRENKYVFIFVSLVLFSLILLGVRGRVEKKSPIRVGTAYFCDDPFLNQLGLNPVFTLFRSYLDAINVKNKPINLMDSGIALQKVKNYLGVEHELEDSPIAREILQDSAISTRPNIIFIIMESMSAVKMQRFGNSNNLTPFLDSIANESYCFDNIYSAGEHTFNGIFSTLYSFPGLYRQHTMKTIRNYSGIASILKQDSYTTTYFTTHDSQFDNVEGFLRANGFDKIISQADYPSEEVKTTLGVPDDYMFRFSIPIINELHEQNKPFFVTFMTASDHGPYYIPAYFTGHSHAEKTKVVEYADWSLRVFLKKASQTAWYNNTIFVFVADHGLPTKVQYPISLNYHHIPFIIFAPNFLEPRVFENIGGQIDVFPTVMGLFHKSYINNTLGIDLIREKRPYIFINGDDKVAALDLEFLFVLKKNEKLLYKYQNSDKTNYYTEYPEKARAMETYLRSNLQVAQDLILSGQTALPKK